MELFHQDFLQQHLSIGAISLLVSYAVTCFILSMYNNLQLQHLFAGIGK